MKNTKKSIALTLAVAIAGTILIVGCRKKPVDMNVSFKMKTTTSAHQKIAAVGSIQWNSGYVVIREIVFDGDRKKGDDVSITHEQISTIDLMTGNANPAIEVEIPSGEYNSVNLGIEIQDEGSSPTVVAEGVYTDLQSQTHNVRFEFRSGEVFEANASSHTFKKNTSPIAEIDFSPAKWFSTITASQLDNATKVNGVILINSSNNSSIFGIVADKLDDATDANFK